MLRQTDPNWEAIFFITDNVPFEDNLLRILSPYKEDPRVTYFRVDPDYQPAYTITDAGYTPTDYVLKHVLKRKDCRWVSATNADNIYGTHVVESIRKNNDLDDHGNQAPDMVLAPLDSRNFADQGMLLQHHMNIKIIE